MAAIAIIVLNIVNSMTAKPQSDGQPAQPPIRRLTLVIYCGFLLTVSGFSVDIMLPVFDAIAQNFGASLSLAQATIPAFMVAFAVGQILFGPLSDAFGRRPMIALGLTIYLAGTALAFWGGSIGWVLAGRAVQGLGAAAGPVIARAILRDTHSGLDLAKAMALAMGIFSIGPIIAPLAGFALGDLFGWRAIFAAMGILGTALLLVDLTIFRETNAEPDRDAILPGRLLAAFARIVTDRQSRYYLGLACAAYCALIAYVANGSRVYATSFGVDGLEFAVLFAISGFGIIVGQVGNRVLLPRLGIFSLLRLAGTILFSATLLALVMALADWLDAISFTALMFLFNTAFLVIVANTLTLVIDPHPQIAGLTSAFFGFVTTAISALTAAATFNLYAGDATRWAIGMTVLTAITLAGLLRPRKV